MFNRFANVSIIYNYPALIGVKPDYTPRPFLIDYLFKRGENGVYFDPSDLDTLFQDHVGSQPVTAPGQVNGLTLDKSKGLELGPELVTTPNIAGEPIGGDLYKNYYTGANIRDGCTYEIEITIDGYSGSGSLGLAGEWSAGTSMPGNGVYKKIVSSRADQLDLRVFTRDTNTANFTNISVRELPGHHATQPDAAKRLTYQTAPDRLVLDKVDDLLTVTVPVGGFTGTMVLATDQGTASYGVSIPAGPYDIGGQYFPGNAIVGQVIRDGAFSEGEASATEAYFVGKGATASYGAVTGFGNYWRAWREITSFPLIDTSSGINFTAAWRDCSSLTSFPLIDTSSGTNFNNAWIGCSSLTSFPLIDTSSGSNFRGAWFGCSSLTSFPANAFDNIKGGNLDRAFTDSALTQTSIDNILVSLVASGIDTGTRVFDQSGGSAPSATGESAITTLRSRGWTVTVTGGF